MTNEIRTEIARQIGTGNLLAISGGRVQATPTGVRLPVAYGYAVDVDYMPGTDLYRVARTFTRSGRTTVRAEWIHVYADAVGDVAYRAGCYRD
jgi:hypothetical protein